MKLAQFKALTFDCYGTLIDWESGLWAALQPLLAKGGPRLGRDGTLEEFARHESAQQAETPALPYSELLARVHRRLAAAWGIAADDALHAAFGASVPAWPAFPDSAEALAYLKKHYKLVVLSNVDRTSFAGSAKRLGVAFDAVYTAEDIGSYKPDPRNFAYLVEHMQADLGLGPQAILHTAQSLFHDHVPAAKAGLARCWIDRRQVVGGGTGATMPVTAMPKVDFHFPSLAAMAEAHRKGG